jgi:histidinol phosphatase-like PHP family hydrolase
MSKINLHAHTCYSNNGGHAHGTPEEIVLKAIELGYDT